MPAISHQRRVDRARLRWRHYVSLIGYGILLVLFLFSLLAVLGVGAALARAILTGQTTFLGLSVETIERISSILGIGVLAIALFIAWLMRKIWSKIKNILTPGFQPRRPFPFETMSVAEVPIRIGSLPSILEDYVDRSQLKVEVGENLILQSRKLLIYGARGVGKTREAVEHIRRLAALGIKHVYFAKGSFEVPRGLHQGFPYRDIALFLDDINPSLEVGAYDNTEEVYLRLPSLSERLREVITFFEAQCGSIDVIITMKTEEYELLKRQPATEEVLSKFLVIELKEMTQSEKILYVEKLGYLFGLALSDEVKASLVEASDESLANLYEFFQILRSRGKNVFDVQDAVEFRQTLGTIWRRTYRALSSAEKLIFDATAKLYQFSIPASVDAVVALCVSGEAGFRLLPGRRFSTAIHSLDGKWLSITEKKVHCHESRLFLKNPSDPSG
jgi:hypothetical protein